ncbi:MAG: exodeoxyribonuclease VII large subunit [Gammaproteobacteria bacterium]
MELPLTPTPTAESGARRDVYSISRLNREVRALLDGHFSLIWVEGEISNLSRPRSGHLYFSLKDRDAQIRCAMFKMRNQLLSFEPGDGMQVLVRARVSLYEPRGDFQLVVEHMEEAGDGLLRRAFEELKNRLINEGLFDPAHKQPLPRLPRRIGVITSPTGAAIRDILSVLRRRFPAIPVLVYPVPVQGAAAASQIARTIRLAGQRQDCDVLVVARGGGSLEDLWAFNEEAVARAIYDCPVPIVSGVGHEVDVTIADFAADHRAATPSAAAELVSPNGDEWLQAFTGFENRLINQARRQHQAKSQALRWLETRLAQLHPARRLNEHGQRLDELEQRLQRACNAQLRHATARSNALVAKLERHDPSRRLQQLRMQEEHLGRRLLQAMKAALEQDRRRLAGIGRALDAVSPLATLSRGYAIVKRLPDGAIVRAADAVKLGDRIETRIARGRLISTVEEKYET